MDLNKLKKELEQLSLEERIKTINEIKLALHEVSPFKNEPVDCVLWELADNVVKNEYNPNAVAPKEMELLKLSIKENGYTQPIVSWKTDKKYEVVDGFHRNRVGKEVKEIKERVYGYLPIVVINDKDTGKNDRIAATIRHNRARGSHSIDGMSNIVVELKKRKWSNEKISEHLGMDVEEIMRLAQITGLAEMFKDQDFSKAWESGNIVE